MAEERPPLTVGSVWIRKQNQLRVVIEDLRNAASEDREPYYDITWRGADPGTQQRSGLCWQDNWYRRYRPEEHAETSQVAEVVPEPAMAENPDVPRYLITEPADGHPTDERCPGCPHPADHPRPAVPLFTFRVDGEVHFEHGTLEACLGLIRDWASARPLVRYEIIPWEPEAAEDSDG